MKWLSKLRRYLFGPSYAERYMEGWKHAVSCVNLGLPAVEFLENKIDADFVFGSRDAFTDGARDALRDFKPALLRSLKEPLL